MNLSHERKISPKFLASILLMLSLLLLIGGGYTVGLWLPMAAFAIVLFFTKSENVINMIPYSSLKMSFFIFIAVGIIMYFWAAPAFSISWFVAALIFSVSFRCVRLLLGIIGLAGLFPNA